MMPSRPRGHRRPCHGDRAARAVLPICLEAVSLRPVQSLPVSQYVISMNTASKWSKCEMHDCVYITCIILHSYPNYDP